MIRFYITTALLLVSLTATAQTLPARSVPVPPPVPTSSALNAPLPKGPSSSATSNNPFAPRAEAAATPALAAADLLPPPPPPPTEQSVRAQVESAFRSNGTRVGRVNGQTFFKLDKDYLFVPTGLEDAQPVVSNKPNTPAAAPVAPGLRTVTAGANPVTTQPQSTPGR